MARTISEKVLDGDTGDIVEREIDCVMVNDVTGVPAFEVLDMIGSEPKALDKTVVIQDHYVPCKDVPSAEQSKKLREYVRKYGIEHYYEISEGGVCHQLMIEEGYVAPGRLIIGADSHTCSYGALGAFGTGVGSTEAAAAMATGRLWFRVPETQKIILDGSLQEYVMSKDIVLHIIGDIGVSGSRYMAQEFYGTSMENLDLAARITISNMAVEAGAKAGIIPPDDKVFSYLEGRVKGNYNAVYADPDAEYVDTFQYNAEEIPPTVAKPFMPSNIAPAAELNDITIDQAYLGSCTNGRIEDLRMAAKILEGKHIHSDVRMIIVPATQRIYGQALREGLLQTFLDAGAYISGATCGACLGGYMGVLAQGERCISSTNRNFIGRMGHKESEVYLASPATVAASALTGHIIDANQL